MDASSIQFSTHWKEKEQSLVKGLQLSTTTILLFLAGMAVLGFADFSIKQTSGKITPSLGTLIYAIAAILPPLIWTIWTLTHEPALITRDGIIWSIITGLAFGTFTGIVFLLFSQGINLSVGTPVVRMGGIACAALLGILVLREGWNIQYIIGFVLTVAGILLIAFH
jgi:drug/metabolite transporter (DMT)-like permease